MKHFQNKTPPHLNQESFPEIRQAPKIVEKHKDQFFFQMRVGVFGQGTPPLDFHYLTSEITPYATRHTTRYVGGYPMPAVPLTRRGKHDYSTSLRRVIRTTSPAVQHLPLRAAPCRHTCVQQGRGGTRDAGMDSRTRIVDLGTACALTGTASTGWSGLGHRIGSRSRANAPSASQETHRDTAQQIDYTRQPLGLAATEGWVSAAGRLAEGHIVSARSDQAIAVSQHAGIPRGAMLTLADALHIGAEFVVVGRLDFAIGGDPSGHGISRDRVAELAVVDDGDFGRIDFSGVFHNDAQSTRSFDIVYRKIKHTCRKSAEPHKQTLYSRSKNHHMPTHTPKDQARMGQYLTSVGIDILHALVGEWIKDERQYRAQVTESRAKGLPYACMMGHADGLRHARHAIQHRLGLVATQAEVDAIVVIQEGA